MNVNSKYENRKKNWLVLLRNGYMFDFHFSKVAFNAEGQRAAIFI